MHLEAPYIPTNPHRPHRDGLFYPIHGNKHVFFVWVNNYFYPVRKKHETPVLECKSTILSTISQSKAVNTKVWTSALAHWDRPIVIIIFHTQDLLAVPIFNNYSCYLGSPYIDYVFFENRLLLVCSVALDDIFCG